MNTKQAITSAPAAQAAYVDEFPYPGPPLIVAIDIMRAFPSAGAALKRTNYGWCEAVGCSRVRGGGDAARAGADVIQFLQNTQDADAAIAYANDRWGRTTGYGRGSNFPDAYQRGLIASKSREAEFKELAAAWVWDAPRTTGAPL